MIVLGKRYGNVQLQLHSGVTDLKKLTTKKLVPIRSIEKMAHKEREEKAALSFIFLPPRILTQFH